MSYPHDIFFYIYKTAGAFAAPPGLFCVLTAFCALHAFRLKARAAGCAAALVPLLLWFMSAPMGAALITGPLEDMYEDSLPADGTRAAVLVLSGGSCYDRSGRAVQPGVYTMERVVRGILLARKLDCPIIMSGGAVYGGSYREADTMARWAADVGFSGRIIRERKSRTTRENLKFSAELARSEGIRRIVLVTDAYHMPRSAYCARVYMPDIELFTFASARVTDPKFRGLVSLLPNHGSFSDSCAGLREMLGLAAYRLLPE